MWRVYGGAVLAIAGIAVFIEARIHKPCAYGSPSPCPAAGHLESMTYKYLLKGGALLVLLGALLVIGTLVRFWQD
jgi:hypothetical protein